MTSLKVSRSSLPPDYVDKSVSTLTWDWVAEQLTLSKHYFLRSVHSNGRPHVVPRWGVFLDDKFYYDGSPKTRYVQNFESDPHVSLHLQSGNGAIILEGLSKPAGKPSKELGRRLSHAFKKYEEMGYTPKADSWDQGGLFVFIPQQCIAWSSFTQDPTRFVFDE